MKAGKLAIHPWLSCQYQEYAHGQAVVTFDQQSKLYFYLNANKKFQS